MMDVMISINPPYTNMIFGGIKPMEFRKKVLNEMLKDDPDRNIYVYETKNHGGCGKVIGKAKIEKVYKVMYKDETEEVDPVLAQERYDCMKDLHCLWCQRRGKSSNEGGFQSARFTQYREYIGWGYPQNFNYAICLSDITLFEKPKELGEFAGQNGEVLKRPPQNMYFCELIQEK